ncbi:hypothetical protein LQE94_08855 [Mediterraneibacter sp. NSJ-151]|uniref:hypothetical protein n=1 Tax=Mediterraneibacter sp. NSJ-151 TaxID=2897708 RepID=UPI000E50BFBE|nr:hypothetical protein [Mediterraneibacter sp. NSJ-151]MCH4280127.1 hypothetical protein [Mediterraneibacter sp. NSJ-151]RHV08632.1 hypothetical protein DXB97_00900 [Firmicutes bacterium OM07-11]
MFTGISKEKALEKMSKGKAVYVVDRNNEDALGNIQMIPLANYLNGLEFLEDVPAVPNPDFEGAVQDMINSAYEKV